MNPKKILLLSFTFLLVLFAANALADDCKDGFDYGYLGDTSGKYTCNWDEKREGYCKVVAVTANIDTCTADNCWYNGADVNIKLDGLSPKEGNCVTGVMTTESCGKNSLLCPFRDKKWEAYSASFGFLPNPKTLNYGESMGGTVSWDFKKGLIRPLDSCKWNDNPNTRNPELSIKIQKCCPEPSEYNPAEDRCDTPETQCSDGIDNDGDGCIDYPYDNDCSSTTDNTESGSVCTPPKECNNGIDDDEDGWTDYPDDPGCDSKTDDGEDCNPSGKKCSSNSDCCSSASYCGDKTASSCYDASPVCFTPKCSDGIDNDGDSLIDYPEDPGCTTSADDNERSKVTGAKWTYEASSCPQGIQTGTGCEVYGNTLKRCLEPDATCGPGDGCLADCDYDPDCSCFDVGSCYDSCEPGTEKDSRYNSDCEGQVCCGSGGAECTIDDAESITSNSCTGENMIIDMCGTSEYCQGIPQAGLSCLTASPVTESDVCESSYECPSGYECRTTLHEAGTCYSDDDCPKTPVPYNCQTNSCKKDEDCPYGTGECEDKKCTKGTCKAYYGGCSKWVRSASERWYLIEGALGTDITITFDNPECKNCLVTSYDSNCGSYSAYSLMALDIYPQDSCACDGPMDAVMSPISCGALSGNGFTQSPPSECSWSTENGCRLKGFNDGTFTWKNFQGNALLKVRNGCDKACPYTLSVKPVDTPDYCGTDCSGS